MPLADLPSQSEPTDDPLPPRPSEAALQGFYPSPNPALRLRDSPIELSIDGYNYAGKLRTNWGDKLTKGNNIGLAILRTFLKLIDGIGFNINIIINLPNPFQRPDSPPNIIIDENGFPGLVKILEVINKKLDNIHEDLPLIVPCASVVEHWQIRPEALRPQCIFLWGDTQPNSLIIGPPKWQTAVPYYDFGLAATFSNQFSYIKGSCQGILTLKDNSKVILYAQNEAEVTRIFNRLLPGIRADMREGHFIKLGEYHGPPFSTRTVALRRIDYYDSGQMKGPQTDYLWFSREILP